MPEIFQILQASPVTFTAACTLLGLIIGSFLNVVIHRLPKMLEREWHAQCEELKGGEPQILPRYNLLAPASGCPHCGHKIGALENVPIISYLLLRGKCKSCRAPISLRYPLVEAANGLLCGYAAWHFGFGAPAFAAILLISALLALTLIDFDTQLLPDAITQPLLWLGLLFNFYSTYTTLGYAVVGAMAGYLTLWSVYWLFKLSTGKEGMGYGDFKLLAALGAWLGWQMLPLVILLSSLVGAIVGILLIVIARQGRNIPIPFGPYLAGGGLIALFWGQALTQSYLQFMAMP